MSQYWELNKHIGGCGDKGRDCFVVLVHAWLGWICIKLVYLFFQPFLNGKKTQRLNTTINVQIILEDGEAKFFRGDWGRMKTPMCKN